MKKVLLLSENKNIIDTVINYFKDRNVEIITTDNLVYYDLIVLDNNPIHTIKSKDIINIHPALLPAFKGKNAIYESFTSGIKVSGATIHKVEEDNFYGQIIAQYPILIGINMHIDEYLKELENITITLLPKVIDSILNDQVFNYCDLFESSCKKGCGGDCSNCNH